MTRLLLSTLFLLLFHFNCSSQHVSETRFTLQDTLRGSVTPERAWWNVNAYAITVKPDFNSKTITGSNVLTFTAIDTGRRMQLDLQAPMEITSIVMGAQACRFSRMGNVYYVNFDKPFKKGSTGSITIKFGGQPREAVTPPWDGGWIWRTDSYGNPWMSVACQGLGASVWYPCKDYQGDEPDSASLTMIVPDTLIGVSNGRLRSKRHENNTTSYTWAVVNPINSYNIIPYIGRYVHWSESFNGENGKLDLGYWVLQENEEKARKQFRQVPTMLKCFEHWMGPYPFYEDGYKIVESPHLGMEHQSGIAYGNRFANGYMGKDLSGTGWGKKWDFIIIHESGHEWFANNITTNDIADMWVHEGFTNYSEVLFTICGYGKQAGNEYCIGLRRNILNDKPLIGPYGVNKEGSNDMYYKGANLVHIIRQLMDDDEKFRMLLRDLNKDFRHKTVTTKQIEKYISRKTGRDLSVIFDQYLRTIQVPVLEYRIAEGKLHFRWANCLDGFDMPIRVRSGDTSQWIHPVSRWKSIQFKGKAVTVDPNFYIGSRKL